MVSNIQVRGIKLVINLKVEMCLVSEGTDKSKFSGMIKMEILILQDFNI